MASSNSDWMSKDSKVQLALVIFLVAALSIIIFIQYLAVDSVNNLRANNENQSYSYDVLKYSDRVLRNLGYIESSTKGFILTQDTMYLQHVDAFVDRAQANLDSLNMASENLIQVRNKMRLITPQILEKIDYADTLLKVHNLYGADSAVNLLRTRKEMQMMDTLLTQIGNVVHQERMRIDKSAVSVEGLSRSSIQIIVTSGIFVCIVVIISFIFLYRDLGRRILLEQDLGQSEGRLKQFLSGIPAGVVVLDRFRRVYYINEAGKKMLGLTEESFDFNHRMFYKYGTNQTFYYKDLPMIKAFDGSVHEVNEIEIRRESDRILVSLRSQPIQTERGDVLYTVTSITDVTIERKSQEDLKAAKALAEQTAEMKENFLANMSHEIRTPMNAILGFNQLLGKTGLSEDQKEYVGAVKTAANNLLTIINDILDSSKIEAGMLQVDKSPFSIHHLVKEVKLILQQKALEKKLDFQVLIDAEVPEFISGDRVRLTQILINLGGNAIKFTNQGVVKIQVSLIEKRDQEVRLRFQVIDSGIGISEEKLQVIFERFTQANTGITRRFGGTGLGLSIVKSLIEIQGGRIWVESRLGEGSTFLFELTYQIADARELSRDALFSEDGIELQGGNYSILVVEDNELNMKLASVILSNHGFAHELAENGLVALEKLQQKSYDIILMDLQMPELDGYEATRIIRDRLQLNVPIIAMTAHAMSDEKDKCLKAGMDDYISKPFHPRDLIKRIWVHLDLAEKEKLNEAAEKVFSLNGLKELIGEDEVLLKEMIETFLTQIPDEMKKLEEAMNAGSYTQIRYWSHKMKSSCYIMGMNVLSELLKGLEISVIQELPAEEVQGQYELIRSHFGEIFPQYRRYVEKTYEIII